MDAGAGIPRVLLCRNVFVKLMEKARKRSEPLGIYVKLMVQHLVADQISEEDFLLLLQIAPFALDDSFRKSLLIFLKGVLPQLRQSLANHELKIDGIVPPILASASTNTAAAGFRRPTPGTSPGLQLQPATPAAPHNGFGNVTIRPRENGTLIGDKYEDVKREAEQRITEAWRKIATEMRDTGIQIIWNEELNDEIECIDLENEEGPLSDNVNGNASTQPLGGTSHTSDGANPLMLIYESEATFIGILSTFLHVHPFGASFDEIVTFTQKIQPETNPLEIKKLINKFPRIFKSEGDGVEQEQKWKFVGYTTN